MADVGGVSDMRLPYRSAHDVFDVGDLVSREPFKQFTSWFDEASNAPDIGEPNAMALATATKDGIPSVRMVLMKGFDKNGIVFFTNYSSRKGNELTENPRCSCMFYWEKFKRSIRIEGNVRKMSNEKSEEYFHSRPRPSQLGAISSNQSQVVESRKALCDRYTSLEEKYKHEDMFIPKPDNWGGYIVTPESFEFWQGQTNRLHDRFKFRRLEPDEKINEECTHIGEDGWVFERLEP